MPDRSIAAANPARGVSAQPQRSPAPGSQCERGGTIWTRDAVAGEETVQNRPVLAILAILVIPMPIHIRVLLDLAEIAFFCSTEVVRAERAM